MQRKPISYRRQRRRSEFLWGWAFLLPTVVGLIILNIYPIFYTIYLSFHKSGDFGRNNIFVGFQNYAKALKDVQILKAMRNSLLYMLMEVPISVALSLVLAALMNQKIRFRTVYRTIIFLPMVAAPAAVAMVWRWLFNTEFGLINHILGKKISWISDPKISLVSIAIIGIWSILGYNMILFLAALQEVPNDYYEAAELDGASKAVQFFRITLPLISPMIYFVLVTRVIAALQVFDTIYMMMDRTNPALQDTQSLVFLFYRYSFVENNRGYGSTIVVLLLLITLIFTALQNYGQKKWVIYD
jgi:multiple sugar transport system permease protein